MSECRTDTQTLVHPYLGKLVGSGNKRTPDTNNTGESQLSERHRPRRLHSVWLQLYDILENVKTVGTEIGVD